MKTNPLEDLHTDILAKAQTGLEISDDELVARAGIKEADLEAVRSGNPDAPKLGQMAVALGLDPVSLLAIARAAWAPEPAATEGVAGFTSWFFDMEVNAYLCWDTTSLEAAAFDSGADAEPMLRFARSKGLHIRQIFLTHTHGDHVADMEKLAARTSAPVWVNEREPYPGARPFHEGASFTVGGITVQPRLTWGHSRGGTTYVLGGLSRPVAIVGDALFAGSIGGPKISLPAALLTIREHIFSLPENTMVCPGHGPLTTVAEEKVHNPFFAGSIR